MVHGILQMTVIVWGGNHEAGGRGPRTRFEAEETSHTKQALGCTRLVRHGIVKTLNPEP